LPRISDVISGISGATEMCRLLRCENIVHRHWDCLLCNKIFVRFCWK